MQEFFYEKILLSLIHENKRICKCSLLYYPTLLKTNKNYNQINLYRYYVFIRVPHKHNFMVK